MFQAKVIKIHRTSFVVAKLPASAISCIEKKFMISRNVMMQTMQTDPFPVNPRLGLQRVDGRQDGLSVRENFRLNPNFPGNGQVVYVVDTGIVADHIEFETEDGSRAISGQSFSIDEPGLSDDFNGHGTHVSGTAVGTSVGVAPSATVVGIKALDQDGGGTVAAIIEAIKYAVDDMNSRGLSSAVINLSLGGGLDQTLDDAVKEAAVSGAIVVMAAGNENQNACRTSPANTGGGKTFGLISVASSVPTTDARSSFSNFGRGCTDLFAPGSSILSAYISSFGFSNSVYKGLSGTSMAAPHVAGALLGYLEKHGGDRALAVQDMFNSTLKDVIADTKGVPNQLLQIATEDTRKPTFSPDAPTPPPSGTPAPSGGMVYGPSLFVLLLLFKTY